MTFEPLSLQGSFLIKLNPISDDRGWFVRTFSKNDFAQEGLTAEWVQMNHSFTKWSGTIRGMHFQYPPHQEVKMIRCIRGRIYDVIIDIRKNSPTFLNWIGVELMEHDMQMLYVPSGMAHGFQALTDNCELIYHHSAAYQPGSEGGLRYDDPLINIAWPEKPTIVSERDKQHQLIGNEFKGI